MLNDILQKPEKQRRQIAIIFTALIGGFVFLIWLLITYYRLQQISTKTEDLHFESVTERFQRELPPLTPSQKNSKNNKKSE